MQKTENQQAIENLEAIINWLKEHPNAPVPSSLLYGKFICNLSTDKKKFADEIRSIGSFKKEFTVKTGTIALEFYTSRKNVCTKRVVGQKLIPEQRIPEKIEPEHYVDLVEWDCDPILEIGEENSEAVPTGREDEL
jgi:hypothetical protein